MVDEEIDFESVGERASRHQRGDMRDSMLLHARMRTDPDADPVPLRIRNLSAGGLMADCSALVEQGQPVEIELRNIGVIGGEIAWCRRGQVGISFFHRIDPRLTRKPVGTHATETMLVKRPGRPLRRPGLRTK